MKGNNALEQLSTVSQKQVQMVDQTTLPLICHSFVGLDRRISSSPPVPIRCVNVKLFETEVDSHTHTRTHTLTRTKVSSAEVMTEDVPL